MLADQFLAAASAAKNTHALDQTARLLWRAHFEGHIPDADAQAISEALLSFRKTTPGLEIEKRRDPAGA